MLIKRYIFGQNTLVAESVDPRLDCTFCAIRSLYLLNAEGTFLRLPACGSSTPIIRVTHECLCDNSHVFLAQFQQFSSRGHSTRYQCALFVKSCLFR